jgi:hypothetical protein
VNIGSPEAADIPNQKVYKFEELSSIGHESIDFPLMIYQKSSKGQVTL